VVIDLLRTQHGGGQTIVMVTHDAEVAAAADRIVHVRDGRTVDDDAGGASGSASTADIATTGRTS
jgi:putative ABC transport system ATP-binding protein